MEAHQQLLEHSSMNTKAADDDHIVLTISLVEEQIMTLHHTDNPDSVDVYFVVNMSNNLDFDPKTQKVHMAGD